MKLGTVPDYPTVNHLHRMVFYYRLMWSVLTASFLLGTNEYLDVAQPNIPLEAAKARAKGDKWEFLPTSVCKIIINRKRVFILTCNLRTQMYIRMLSGNYLSVWNGYVFGFEMVLWILTLRCQSDFPSLVLALSEWRLGYRGDVFSEFWRCSVRLPSLSRVSP